jgi:hypothetical protein
MDVRLLTLTTTQRRILADLVEGAVLIKRFGGYETYREIEGKVRPCGNRLEMRDLQAFGDAVPELLPLRTDMGNDVLRIPAACRAGYADALQVTMPLRDLIEEFTPAAYPRMRGGA